METNSFDAIVVGSGMSGGWAAKELTEKGLKTLVLERGRMVRHPDYPTATKDPWDLPYGNLHHAGNPPAQTGSDAHGLSHARQSTLVRRRSRQSLCRRTAVRLAARLSRRWTLAHVGAPELSLRSARLRSQRQGGRGHSLAGDLRRDRAVVRQGRKSSRASAAASKVSSNCPTASFFRRTISIASKSISRNASTKN